MSTLVAQTLSNGTVSTSTANCIQGSAKAWVNFNGTGTVSIRASYNVSSITDNGTGDYTINFTNALSTANYAISASAARNNATEVMICGPRGNASTYSTSAIRIATVSDSGSAEDSPIVAISVFI
jgi:hypothetical protein